jgi:hypothetical protein
MPIHERELRIWKSKLTDFNNTRYEDMLRGLWGLEDTLDRLAIYDNLLISFEDCELIVANYMIKKKYYEVYVVRDLLCQRV